MKHNLTLLAVMLSISTVLVSPAQAQRPDAYAGHASSPLAVGHSRDTLEVVNATIGPKCKIPGVLELLKSVVGRYGSVLKIYNMKAFGETPMGVRVAASWGTDALLGTTKMGRNNEMAGMGIGARIPMCVANVVTTQGDHLWGYGASNETGETIFEANVIE